MFLDTDRNPFLPPSQRFKLLQIDDVICQTFRIARGDLHGATRRQRITHPRQVAMSLARVCTTLSLQKIASHYGREDHTTVLHGVRAVARCPERADMLVRVLDELHRRCEAVRSIGAGLRALGTESPVLLMAAE